MGEGRSTVNARTVLWYLVFIGFAVNYMLRINVNITIVDMVRPIVKSSVPTPHIKVSECAAQSADEEVYFDEDKYLKDRQNMSVSDEFDLENNTMKLPISRKTRGFSPERYLMDTMNVTYEKRGFDWNAHEQGLVLGSFFWLHWITQIPGGILARKYGTKLVFGLSNLIGTSFCFLMPIISYWDIRVLIFFRILQGLICGLAWPAMHNMTALWIPPNERSKFVTAYMGSSVGIALCYPMFGYIISWSSWEMVFHACGIIGIVWYLGWYYFVFDTPAKHPRIDPEEREYIEKSLGSSIQKKSDVPMKTPWRAILTDRAVWMTVAAQWGGIWGLFTIMTQAPTYFKYIHGWNIKMTGILSGFPHILKIIFAILFSMYGDYMLRNNKMSRTNVRRLAGTVCCIVNGCFIAGLAYSGCNSNAAIIFLTLGTAVHGAVSTGPLATIVDLSPNYAGILLGISGMIGVLPGFVSPIIVGVLTLNNQTIQQWKYVFLICAGMLIGSGFLYVIFGDSELKPWNTPVPKIKTDTELQRITKNIDPNENDNNIDKINVTTTLPSSVIEEEIVETTEKNGEPKASETLLEKNQ